MRYDYSSFEEFKEQIGWDLDSVFDERDIPYTVDTDGDECVITVKDVPYRFPISKIEIEPDKETDDSADFDIDIDDIDFSDDSWINDLIKQ